MSFRDFKEEIYLILQIKGGHGFGFTTSPLLVTANLAGNIHESFITEPCPQPKFESEFVWVMDKTKMKSIWSDKVPVRVECFTVNQPHRNRIGYIILNVKDSQVVHDQSKITEKQIRLLGLSKDVSLLKPELIISFYITDVPIQNPQLVAQFSPPLEGRQLHMSEGPPKVTIGSAREHLSFSITVDGVSNLKELLPSHSELDPALLTYTYSLLGAEIVSDVSTRHRLQLALTSSWACLKTYFVQQPLVTVQLHMDSLLLGHTTLNLESVLLSEDTHLRRSKQQSRNTSCRCFLSMAHDVAQTPTDCRPSVDFSISFTWDTPLVKKKPEASSAPSQSSVGAGGDADNSQLSLPLQTPVTLPLHSGPVERGRETYRTQPSVTSLTLVVTITSLHLDRPLTPHSWLRLSGACESVCPAHQVTTAIPWTPLHWQLSVCLPPQLLQSTLTNQPPVLHLGVGEKVLATALLHPPSELTEHTKQWETMASLERGSEKVGEVGVAWAMANSPPTINTASQSATTLTDTSLSPPTHSKTVGPEVLSPRARELKMLSFVEELEDWAEKQRIIIMERLKEEEAARLSALQAQWEAEIGGQMAEGRQLVEALHSMRDQLRQQESDLKENQLKLKVYKEELERVHRSKLQEFKDLSRRMQDEFNHKLALIASDKVALEREVEGLKEENTQLRGTLREADGDKRVVDNLTHELKMLKEKLSVEQDSKKFFKEHCRKAEQEIHRLNCLRQQELEARLHTEKKSLEQLAFQQIIVERSDQRQDQRLLEEIRQQLLNNTDINSNSNTDTGYTDDRHIRRAT